MKDIDYSFVTYSDSFSINKDNNYICYNNLFAIIDGVGRDYLGKKATSLARETILELFFKYLEENNSPGDAIFLSLKEANKIILEERLRINEKMAASICILYIQERIMYFSHLGDARIYAFQDNELNQLTRDHTLREEDPFAEKRYDDPRALQALMKGLGIHEAPEIYIKKYPLDKKGNIILTTERFTERVSNRDLLWLSKKITNPKKLGKTIVELFRRKGGDKGFTLGIIRFGIVPRWLRKVFSIYLIYSLIIMAIVFGYISVYHDDNTSKPDGVTTEPVIVKNITDTTMANNEETGPPETVNVSAVRQQINIPKKEEAKIVQPLKSPPDKDIPEKVVEKPAIALNDTTESKDIKDTNDTVDIKKEVQGFLMDWKNAWEKSSGKDGDISSYISFYSDDFRSGKLDKKGWATDKTKRNKGKKWIKVGISDIRISEPDADNRLKVKFRQEYSSSNFSVKSGKTMVLIKTEERWEIVSEESN
jgi:serine/threonine protein phosphatase PrpC